jgi:hypothetical protein
VERFNGLCATAIQDLLVHGRRSACQASDPTGRDALDRATALRRKLRSLKRRGQLPDTVNAELQALRVPPARGRSAHATERGTGRRSPALAHDPVEDTSGDLVLG